MKLQNYEINEKLTEVGVIDDRDVPFHRLMLEKGTTYNSYFYDTEKPTIIDTVDLIYGKAFVANMKEKMDLKDLQYIVINHVEPDHSGALAALLYNAPNATIVCTEKAVYNISELYRASNRNFLVVTTGSKLDIGGKTLEFYFVPNLHTEETMMTYCIEDEILFPCDIFSTHVACTDFAASKTDIDFTEDFILYYDLIMSPHKIYVQNMMRIVKALDLKIIAPSHGYILDKDIDKYLDIYSEKCKCDDREHPVTVVYTSMRGTTKKVAEKFAENFNKDPHYKSTVFDADKDDHEEILKAIENSDIILFGSSTKYGNLIGVLEDLLKALPDLTGKYVGAFGSFGWSGESIEIIQDYLLNTKANILTTSDAIKKTGTIEMEFPLRVRYNMDESIENTIEKNVIFIKSQF